ncbi:dephospho-CoA kinase [Thalassotalea piscium]|uniref:Dephospho-CoA kinase n=1 Tax=Thalassotalea piscium TaxID=1230533 RepID=A0A7X0NE54_9GAMM|nr:dephospho-CoA kinase [Thalassotalea piscium]MBB6541767.1 dephospho-CoA kinase [Thalassotalea piscium]
MANYIVGLSGGIGSGKTTVSKLFEQHGVSVIDADIIARDVVVKGSEALTLIIEYFGENFLLPTGELDRTKLRTRIFSNSKDKLWLNNLLHPLIRKNIIQALEQAPSDYCLLVAPLLLENNLQHLVDRVLIVDVSEEIQIKRTLTRDKSSEVEIRAIINSQISRHSRQQAADDIINNNDTDLAKLEENVRLLHQKYLENSKIAE